MNRLLCAVILLLVSSVSYAENKPLMRCGPFTISSSDDGFAHINDQRPETQGFTFLGQKDDYSNVKYQWMLPEKSIGRWIGLDYIKRDKKAILNVEVIRKSMDEPRRFWTYDCVRVAN